MCLTDDFFNGYEERYRKWSEDGLSISEACSRLSLCDTTTYPIATEVAEFIYRNWTLSEVDQLPDEIKSILFEILKPYKIKNSDYLESINSTENLSRPIILVEDISTIDLLADAVCEGNDKEIYQKCLSILYLKDRRIFEAVAREITSSSRDRVFLGYCEKDILNGKDRPADAESRDPIKLLIGKPLYTYGKLSNQDKIKNIEKFFDRVFEKENISFNQTSFSNSLQKKLEITGKMTKKQAQELLEGLL
ncbi:hypothetical protein P2G88_06680 [Aliiglaciecola sp. CAU 1673]|uniref:hypothetical protein n=1 Tax=Aliiglaciecola sp. CAU 1673 TaxID=3032595 RepID=UPI0023DB248E|nr:hypothetical protein [Aliiglaciecola sp. CAU 1673]MDF2177932.1 hypothetical protein [Aliiglaciecola sp. CAU 1673]